jgi:hypothetical protein
LAITTAAFLPNTSNTVDGDIITDLSNLEITADGNLVLKANLSSQTDINLTSHHGIKSEVRSLLILNLVITPSLISERYQIFHTNRFFLMKLKFLMSFNLHP